MKKSTLSVLLLKQNVCIGFKWNIFQGARQDKKFGGAIQKFEIHKNIIASKEVPKRLK